MQSEKTALGYCVTKINLMQKLIFRNPSDLTDFLKNNFQKFSTDHSNLSLSWFDSSAEIHFAKAHKEAYEFYMKNMTKVITSKFKKKYKCFSDDKKSLIRKFKIFQLWLRVSCLKNYQIN
jgi:hypothetical protein